MTTEVPEAWVIEQRGYLVTIECSYCGKRHQHTIRKHGAQHFAPACGLYLNPDQRAAGYRFYAPKPGQRRNDDEQ